MKKTKMTAAVAMAILSGHVTAAETVTYRGSIKTELPTVSSSASPAPVSFVKDYKLSLNADGGICELTTDDAYARRTITENGKWICLVEWDAERYGLAPNRLDLAGVLNADGTLSFGYKLSIYSEGTKKQISTGTVGETVSAPQKPVITGYQSRWAKKTERTTGNEQWTYDKSDVLSEATINVEARPFPQKVMLNGQECSIREGSTSCQIRIAKNFLDATEEQGALTYTGTVADTKGYFDTETKSDLLVNWDFRAPAIEHLAYNVDPGAQPKSVEHEGITVELQANQAVAFVKTPHTERPDSWWIPSDMTMSLIKSDGKAHSAIDEVAGVPVRFAVANIGYSVNYSARPVGSPAINNGYLIYTYDLSTIPDGKYDISVKPTDLYANSTQLADKEKLIDRYGPDIKVLNGRNILGDSITELYFTEDLTIAANGGWDDGTEIKSVKWNGVPTSLSGDSARIKVPEHKEFSLDSTVNLEVTAADGAGNTTVKNLQFSYMPVAFAVSGVPSELFESVESTAMRLSQTKGAKCKVATSPELAQVAARGVYKGCTVVWNDLPTGLESVVYPTSFALQGGIDKTGEVSWGYDVYFHNTSGFMAKAAEGSVSVNVKASEHPKLELMSLNKLSEGVYGASRNSNQITRYELTTVPADNVLHVKASNGETDKKTDLKQRLRKEVYTVRNALKRTQSESRMAWDRTTYTVDAYHKRKPESADSKTFDLITFPDGGVKSMVTLEASQAIDTDKINAAISVGKRRAGAFTYSIPQMGRWKTYLAIRLNGKYEAITETIDLDENGKGSFTFDSDKLFDRAKAVYAISESISPYPEYNRTLVSGAARLAVFQSEALAGDLTARTVQGRIPFSASMRFEFEDKNDKAASAGFSWERSDNGADWAPLDLKLNQKMYSARITEVGESYYRIKMTNKMTNEVSYTAPIRVVGYMTPDVWIEGEDTVYEGGYATLTVFSDETDDVDTDGFTEWSTDDGATWVTGDSVREFKVDQSMRVLARYRLNSTDETVGDAGYKTTSHKVNAVKLQPVRVRASGPRHAEIGTTVVLKASAQHANRNVIDKLFTYWTTPSGNVIEGTNIEYTITESDIQDGEIGTFVFSSYVDGLEAETKATSDVSMSLWSYTMPDIKLALLSRVQIAPATIAARVDVPYFYAPGVELQYQWVLPEGVSISRESSSLTYLTAESTGVQRIGIQISDNRGNSKEVFEFIDIVQANPLAIGVEIKPSNTFERVPVSYSVRTNAKPGHPNDSMQSYSWWLNGEELTGQTKPYANVEVKEPGDHQLTVKFLTKFGQEGELNQTLTAMPNKPPVCEPFITETSSSITVNANCKDEDGKIISLKYSWREDGYESSGGTRLRFTKSLHDKLNISIRATDDSGEESMSNIEWINPNPKVATP